MKRQRWRAISVRSARSAVTRLEPETTVAWEGDAARGTVRLEPSGWGTRVTLTAETGTPAPGDDALTDALDSLGATHHRPFSR